MARNPYLEEFEGYFGPTDPYDPIDTSPFATDVPSRSALPVNQDDPTTEGLDDLTAIIDSALANARTPVPEGEGKSALDLPKAFAAGALNTVGDLGIGVLEYGARQAGLTDEAEVLAEGRRGLGRGADWLLGTMSEEAQQGIAKQILSLDPNKSIWRGGVWDTITNLGLKVAQTLPSSLATMLPAARLFKAGMKPGAITYLGASEGGMSVGGIASGIADEIESMSYEELYSESDRFRQLMGELNDEDQARAELTREAQGMAPAVGGALVGAIGATAGRYLEPVITGVRRNAAGEMVEEGAGLASRFGRGFLAEAPQEGTQSPAETIAQNYAAQAYDADRELTAGAAESAAEGTLIGGLIGGGFTSVSGKRPTPPEPPPQMQEPPEGFTGPRAPRDTGEPFEDVFGPGGVPQEEGTATFLPALQMADELNQVRGTDADIAAAAQNLSDVNTQVAQLEQEYATAQQQLARAEQALNRPAKQESTTEKRRAAVRKAMTRVRQVENELKRMRGEQTRAERASIDADTAAAAANIRQDNMMGDLFEATPEPGPRSEDPAEVAIRNEQLPLTGGIDTDPRSGRDLSPSREFTNKWTAGFVPEEMAGQQEFLPFPGPRRRGVGRTTERLGGTQVPTQQPALPGDEELNAVIDSALQGASVAPGEDVALLARRREGTLPQTTTPEERYQAGQEDLFREDVPVEQETETQRPPARAVTAAEVAAVRGERPFLLTVTDDEGNQVGQEVYETAEEANTWQEFYYENFPDYNYTITRPRREEIKTGSALEDVRTIQAVRDSEAADRRRGRPKTAERGPTEQARTQTETQRELTFEERTDIPRGRRAPRTTAQAAARLVGEQVRQAREAETRRIGGFYNPDDLVWEPPKVREEDQAAAQKATDRAEKRYRDAWGALVDAEITLELSGDSQQRGQANLIRDAALEELAKVRRMARPKRRTEQLQAAAKLEPRVKEELSDAVRKRGRQRTPEEQEVDEYVATPEERKTAEESGLQLAEDVEAMDRLARELDVESRDTLLNITDERLDQLNDTSKKKTPAGEKAKEIIDDLFELAIEFQSGLAKTVRNAIADQARGQAKSPQDRLKELRAKDQRDALTASELREMQSLEEEQRLMKETFGTESAQAEGPTTPSELTGESATWADVKEAVDEGIVDLPDFDPLAFSGLEDVGLGNIAPKTRKQFLTPANRLKFIRRMRVTALRQEAGGKQGGGRLVADATQGEPVPYRTETFEAENKADAYAKEMAQKFPTARIDIEQTDAGFTVTVELQPQPQAKSRYTTVGMVAEARPQDESKSQRLAREKAAKEQLKRVKKSVTAATSYVKKVNKDPEFVQELGRLKEDGTGLSKRSADILAGRAYFMQMIQYAEALASSEKLTKEARQDMERIANWLDKYTNLPADKFANKMAQMFRAQGRDARNALKGVAGKKTLSAISSEDERLRTMAQTNERIEKEAEYIRRFENKWVKSKLYRDTIRPLIQKFHYDPQYMPSPQELEDVKHAMDKWLTSDYEGFYKPIKPLLADYGFAFAEKDGYWVQDTGAPPATGTAAERAAARQAVDPEKFFKVIPKTKVEDAGYPKEQQQLVRKGEVLLARKPNGDAYHIRGENMLQREYTKMFGDMPETNSVLPSTIRSMADVQTEQRRLQAAKEDRPPNRNELAAQRNQGAAMRRARLAGIIDKFKATVAPAKVTIDGIVKAENAFVRRMQELGAWTQINDTMATIQTGFGKTRSYRLVGPRLQSRELTKAEAKDLIAKLEPAKLTKRQQEQVDRIRDEVVSGEQTVAEKLQQVYDQEAAPLLEALDLVDNAVDYREAASAAANPMNDRTANVRLNEVLGPMIENLPKDSPWRPIAQRMFELGMDDVLISYDWGGNLGTEAGKFFSRVYPMQGEDRFILINQKTIDQLRKEGKNADAVFIHTVLHEASHAATIGEMESNPALKDAMTQLQQTARKEFEALGIELPYGFREEDNVNEFVAEAFTNIVTQRKLKQVRVPELGTGRTFWDRFVKLVKQVFNWGDSVPDNLLEAVLMTGEQLFTGAARGRWGLMTANLEVTDNYVKPKVTEIVSRLDQSSTVFRSVRRRASELAARGLRAPLGALTMEQLRDTFGDRFQSAGDNPLKRYMENFFQRNSYNSELMEEGERLSRKWTELEEKDVKNGTTEALDVSYAATFATLYQVTPDADITAEQNQHLKSDKAKERYYEARRLYDKLSPEAKDIYKTVREYYRKTVRLESALVTSNALRGVLTKATDAPLDAEAFNQQFTPEKIEQMTDEQLSDAVSPYLKEKELREILRMHSIPRQYSGDYFPLMRYGDFVVFGTKELESKSFTDGDQAWKYAGQRREEDPTLDVSVRKDGNKWVVKTVLKDFRTGESFTEAERAKREMQDDNPGMKVSAVQRKAQFDAGSTIETNSALQSILNTLGENKAAQQAIKEFYLKTLSDQSFRKHEIKRKQRRGVDFNLQHRNFANYAKSSSYYIAQLRYGWRMADALGDMNTFITKQEEGEGELGKVARLGDVHRELVKRDNMQVQPPELMNIVRGGTELGQFMMLTSPSYWMINATQPWLVTLPWMAARYGWKASGASLTRAQKLIKPELLNRAVKSKAGLSAFMSKVQAEEAFNVLDEVLAGIDQRDPQNAKEYRVMLEELRRHSVIDLSWIAELRDMAEARKNNFKQRTLDASRIMAHLTEVNNRILVSIAAYDMKRQEALAAGAGVESAIDQATEYAKQAVSTTQFNYSSANKPRWFQPDGPMGPLSPLVFQFMQWPQHMYFMMISNSAKALNGDREAMKVLMNVSATHLAVGGVLGWALQPIKVAIGLLLAGLDPEDEEWTLANALSGETFDRITERGMAEAFGTDLGGVISRGIPSALGTDLSDRMSLGTLYFLDFRSGNPESVLGSLLLGFGGPMVSIGTNFYKGVQDFGKGDPLRGLERMMPKMAKDLFKAGRYMNEGLVNNAGDTMIPASEFGPYELFLQSLGFNLDEVSRAYRKQGVMEGAKGSVDNKKRELLRKFRELPPNKRGSFWPEIMEFNRENPQAYISYETLLRSMEGQRERESQFRRYGASMSDEEALVYGEKADYIP